MDKILIGSGLIKHKFNRLHLLSPGILLLALISLVSAFGLGFNIIRLGNVQASNSVVSPIVNHGLDAHDGHVQKFGNTYYMYYTAFGTPDGQGTACYYEWLSDSAKNRSCGFFVRSASSIKGPWSEPKQLFDMDNKNTLDPQGRSWVQSCLTNSGTTGGGNCWNPRMIQRAGWGYNDNMFILYFINSTAGQNILMGCDGPMGPCGPNPDGSTRSGPYGANGVAYRMKTRNCGGWSYNIMPIDGRLILTCTVPAQTKVSIEDLGYWGADTERSLIVENVGTDSSAMYKDPSTGKYIMTFSDQAPCGLCRGTATGYATSPSIWGPWTWPKPAPRVKDPGGAGQNQLRVISPSSGGGQPMSISLVDGQPYQWVDFWGDWQNGTPFGHQKNAAMALVPMNYRPATYVPGTPWYGEFDRWPF